MTSTSLCEQCRQIRFEALLGPTPKDLDDVQAGNFAGARLIKPKDGTEFSKINLGHLGQMRANMSACPLCSLFVNIIETQGMAYDDAKGRHSLDSKDVYFQVDLDTAYFAKVTPQNGMEQSYFVLRRANITAHHVRSPEATVAYLDHVLQPCRVGEISGPSDDSAQSDVAPLQFGGRRRPQVLDIRLVKGWIDTCQKHHGTSCRLDERPRIDLFRLIDVQRRCICEFRDVIIADLQYVALSYVWGIKIFFQLKSHNSESMGKDGSIDAVYLPQTILDSIELLRRLGLRYLWVDALCIQQDNIDDKVYQITRMSSIYLSAFFTVVAAAGEDPERGLPGLREGTRRWEQREVVVIPPSSEDEGLSVVNCLKSYTDKYNEYYSRGQESVDMNKWSHRAWTLQETALSHRRLTFTDEQVFWTCQQGYFCEESWLEVPEVRIKHFMSSVHKISMPGLGGDETDPWALYSQLVDNYTRRDITYDGDIFDAFVAVTQAFERQVCTDFLWGLPCSHLEMGLMWDTDHGIKRRTALSTLPMTSLNKQVTFPTWSWMGWRGQTSCRVTLVRQESESSTIICYIYSAKSQSFEHVTRLGLRLKTESKLWSNDQISSRKLSLSDIQSHLPRLTPKRLAEYPDSYLLFFETFSTHFTVRCNQKSAAVSFNDYADSAPPFVLDSRDGDRVVGRLCRVPDGEMSTEPYTAEFIKVGERSDPGIPAEIMPPMALVLQIKRDDDGVAQRLNFGDIELDAWESAKPKACIIALA